MAELTKERAGKILQSRGIITEAGKYTVRVTNCNMLVNPQIRDEVTTVAIANFGAMNPYQAQQAKKHYSEGNFSAATNQSLSLGIRDNDYLPSKGETVDIMVEYVALKKDGELTGERALLVTSLTPIKAKEVVAKFSLESEEVSEALAEDDMTA